MPCSNAAKTQNPLKLAGVPQTPERILAVSGPQFSILWGHLEDILLLNKFFFRLSIRALVTKIVCDGAQMAVFADFLRPVFSASRVQHISDLHSKFALGPRDV